MVRNIVTECPYINTFSSLLWLPTTDQDEVLLNTQLRITAFKIKEGCRMQDASYTGGGGTQGQGMSKEVPREIVLVRGNSNTDIIKCFLVPSGGSQQY